MIRQWNVVSAVSVASAIELARGKKTQQTIDAVNRLFFVARWICGHGKIALLYADDLTTFIRRRHWFGPAHCQRIDGVPLQDCYTTICGLGSNL
jgi:hypothetical protein